MDCRICHIPSEVHDTRKTGNSVRRRRVCPRCRRRWTTYEVSTDDMQQIEQMLVETIAQFASFRKKIVGASQLGAAHEVSK